MRLKPFKKMCMTIGNLPSSFAESMSYYDTLAWLNNYLATVIIPVVNNNSEVVEELQEAYITLKNYLDNYFENLDVQEEVNNKLDEMAQNGDLENVISSYLTKSGLIIFNTKALMKGATNLSEGSSVKTLGEITYNDGKGVIYKVRRFVSTDVVDEDNIVSLTNYPTLIAEKLIDLLKQDKLVSGENIKTFNGESILGSGNIVTMTTQQVQELINASILANNQAKYHIGKIIIDTENVNPSTYLGFGTWELIKDKFLLCCGDIYSAGSTGGNSTHTITINEMPSHNHTQASCTNSGNHTHNTWNTYGIKHASGGLTSTATGEPNDGRGNPTAEAGNHNHTITLNNTGGGQAMNIMPPYLAVYVWKRTA